MITSKIAQLWFKPMSFDSKCCAFSTTPFGGDLKENSLIHTLPKYKGTIHASYSRKPLSCEQTPVSKCTLILETDSHILVPRRRWCVFPSPKCGSIQRPCGHPPPPQQLPGRWKPSVGLYAWWNWPNVPFSRLRKLLFCLMLPSKLVPFPSSPKMPVITSPKCSQVFPQLERDIAFDQVAFDCSPEDTCELGHTELLARSGQTMRQKMQFYIPIYYPMTSIVYRIVCRYSFADCAKYICVYKVTQVCIFIDTESRRSIYIYTYI